MRKITETSLSRIWHHIIKDQVTFGVVSAFRKEFSDGDNLILHKQLGKRIRALGLGSIEQKSGYTYLDDSEEVLVEERSYFIPNITLKDVLKLGLEFEQESILFKDNSGFFLIDCEIGEPIVTFSKGPLPFTFSPTIVKQAFSQLIRTTVSQKVKFAYILEKHIPSRLDSLLAAREGGLAKSEWIRVIEG